MLTTDNSITSDKNTARNITSCKLDNIANTQTISTPIETGTPPANNDKKILLNVAKMMCPHCEKTIVNSLCSLDFVKNATANFKTGIVALTVTNIINETKIREVIEKSGYELISISQ